MLSEGRFRKPEQLPEFRNFHQYCPGQRGQSEERWTAPCFVLVRHQWFHRSKYAVTERIAVVAPLWIALVRLVGAFLVDHEFQVSDRVAALGVNLQPTASAGVADQPVHRLIFVPDRVRVSGFVDPDSSLRQQGVIGGGGIHRSGLPAASSGIRERHHVPR